MTNLGARNQERSRRRRGAARRLRPAVMALEGRELLSTFTVTSTADDNSAGTLRSAINQANASNQPDTIVFSSLFDTPQTITLTGGALALTGSAATTITGPGADLLTVSGGGTSSVFVDSGTSATISGMTITGGSATVGGGVRNDGGTLTLSGVAVRGNAATDRGGGIATRFGASTTLVDSLVSGNTAVNEGGGLLVQGATMSVTNVTVAGNSVSSGVGGGLASDDAATTLVNDTIAGNTAGTGGGLAVASGSATLTNTIVGTNVGGDVSGTVTGGHNVIGGDPELGPLGDYGGPTFTMPLLPGSPAIGAGTSTGAPTTDQRGQARSGAIDAGAFASQLISSVNTAIDGVGSAPGQISLRQAVNLANALTSEDAIVFSSAFRASPRTITLTAGPLVLTDKATTTIVGPGASLLTLSGNNVGRVLELDGGAAAIQDLTITGGVAAEGGGVWNDGGDLVMTDAVIAGDTAAAGDGGGLLATAGTTTLNGVTFSGDTAAGNGTGSGGDGGFGGALATSGTATLTGCTLSGNTAVYGGGAANLDGSLTLDGCTVSGNMAVGTGPVGGKGGGIDSTTGTLAMNGCTISGNRVLGPGLVGSAGVGGGVYAGSYHASPTTTATNCTITGNSAVSGGGGMYLTTGSATLVNCTITGNFGTGQAGSTDLTMVGGEATLTNTIATGASGDFGGSNNLIGVAPDLTALGFFGGPTMTMVPLPGSPAIGAGTAAGAPATDQRGFSRPGGVDIGAYQTQPGLLVNTTADGNTTTPGTLDLRQAVNLANLLPSADTIAFSGLFKTPQTITLTGGQLVIDDRASTTISGPGANLLSISGGGASRVFGIYGGSAAIQGLTITGGRADFGGGLRNIGGAVALTDCTISGNSAVDIAGGAATSGGGGLYNARGTLTLTGCTVTGNWAYHSGGGLANDSGTTTLLGCTISGNSGVLGGGGLFNHLATMSLTNCTVSGNSTAGSGGGELGGGLYNLYNLSLTNCTVTGNVGGYGGGLYSDSPAMLTNTIIAGNSANRGGADLYGRGGIGGSNNLIGGNPLLAPLGSYGGPTQTIPLLPGSPAIGAGTATGAPTVDQRGEPRTGHVDIGAFQSQGFTLTPAPGSNTQSTSVGTAFPNPIAVVVTANNPVEPVDGGVISFVVTPVGGASASLSAATATIANGRAGVTATANDTRGTYIVTASTIGAGSTGLALTNTEKPGLTVTTTADVVDAVDGLTSLREAIAYANSHPGPDTIVLGPGLLGHRKRKIKLTGGPLVLTDPATTTIIGPGAKRLTISAGGRSRVFDVEDGSLELKGLTVSGGRSARGGGILNQGGTLVLDRVVIRGNHARVGGGVFNDGKATLTHVTIEGNAARVGSGLFTARKPKPVRRGSSLHTATGPILSDNFNGTGGVPRNWTQILGAAGDVQEKPQDLTITDSTGASAGIVSTLPKSAFDPRGVVTSIVAQVNGINPDGNAIFGLIGLSGTGSLTGYLAAGIDANGNVFIVEQTPKIPQTIVPIGVDKGYTGGPILLKFIVNAQGVRVAATGFDSGEVSFSKVLHGFSLATAFGSGAIPALVGASQPNTKGGSARFGSISVSTALGQR